MNIILRLVFLYLLFPSVSIAEEKDEKLDRGDWESQAEIGFVKTAGNTNTSSTNTKFDTKYDKEVWRHTFHIEAYSAETDNKRSAERYQASAKTDYKFNEYDYVFGLLEHDKDLFSGFEYQSSVSTGYGRRVLNRETMTLDMEIGPGRRYTKVDNMESESEGFIHISTKYLWTINKNSKLSSDLTYDIGKDLRVTKWVTSLQAKVNSKLAMKISYTVKHNSDVPIDTEKTDIETSVTLVYSF